MKWGLIAAALLFLAAFVLVPAAAVVVEALRDGVALWWKAVSDADAWAAIRLTLLVAAIAVPLNAAFGVAAAWSLTRFRYPGRSVLLALIDLPFGVSPVISGMVTVLLFGAHGWFGPWLDSHGVKVVFAVPGIVLATVFVTFPFVARELIPFMEAQGTDEEEAAHVLGASGWQGMTNTLPLHVEILYNEYSFRAAFAVASLLFLLALVTLFAKKTLEWRQRTARREAARRSAR